MFFSIIIPVYNVADYLRDSVDSVLRQDFSGEYEIILIDDGSTDDSAKICDEYARNHSNIRVIHQRNSGPSVARNAGLDAAIGEYIVFLDGDDWLESDALKNFHSVLKESKCELLSFRYRKILLDGEVQYQSFPDNFPSGIYDADIVLEKGNTGHQVWDFVYLRDFLQANALRFVETISYGEDNLFITQVSCKVTRTYFLDYVGYNYRQREGSSMMRTDASHLRKRAEDILFVAETAARNVFSLSPRRILLEKRVGNLAFTVLRRLMESSFSKEQIDTRINRLRNIGLYPLPPVATNLCFRFYRLLSRVNCPIPLLRVIFKILPVSSSIWSLAETFKGQISKILRGGVRHAI